MFHNYVRRCIRCFKCALAATLVCTTAPAQDTQLTSRPAGFVRIEINGNNQALVCMPFDAFDPLINEVVGTNQLTGSAEPGTADRVLKFDPVVPGYTTAFKSDGNWYDLVTLELSEMELNPGTAVWIDNRQGVTQQVFLAGELVAGESNSVVLLPGLNMLGYPYSTARDLSDTTLSDMLNDTTRLLSAAAGEVTSGTLGLGKGYWLHNQGEVSQVWTELRPYEDIFPEGDTFPRITAVDVVQAGTAIRLSIAGSLEKEALLDVFYKDVAGNKDVQLSSGWKLAAKELSGTATEWTDTGSADRAPVNEVSARYYLVGRADIDVNANGIPDAREIFVNGVPMVGVAPMVRVETGPTPPVTESQAVDPAEEPDSSVSNSVEAVERPWIPGRIIYVDAVLGKDSNCGRAPIVISQENRIGPKQTIAAGLAAAQRGDRVVIKAGRYPEPLDISGPHGREIVLKGHVDISGRPRRRPVIEAPVPPVSDPGTNAVPCP